MTRGGQKPLKRLTARRSSPCTQLLKQGVNEKDAQVHEKYEMRTPQAQTEKRSRFDSRGRVAAFERHALAGAGQARAAVRPRHAPRKR